MSEPLRFEVGTRCCAAVVVIWWPQVPGPVRTVTVKVRDVLIQCRPQVPGPVPDQDPKPAGPLAQVHEQLLRLLDCPRPVRTRG